MNRKTKGYIINSILYTTIIFSTYGQITLTNANEAADFAVSNSLKYSIAAQNISNNMIMARYNIGEFLPSFEISWSEDDSVKQFSSDSRSKSLSVSLNQFLFDGGKRQLSYEMANTEVYYNYLSYKQELLSFKSQIIDQYYGCVMQMEMVKIKNELKDHAAKQLEILAKELEIGRALETDYLNYLISYKQLENECKIAERNMRSSLRKFNIALNLDPEYPLTIDNRDSFSAELPFQIEDQVENLWLRYCAVNPEFEKNQVSLKFAQKQYNYSTLFYMPEISLNAGVSLSGAAYPLTQPSYSVKLNFNFANNPLIPVSFSLGYSFSDAKLTSVKNSSSVSVTPQPDYFQKQTASKLGLISQFQDDEVNLKSSYESFFEQLASYDDSIDSIAILSETITLLERKLKILEQQVELGKVTRLKYLEEMTQLASKRIELLQSKASLTSLSHSIEILLDIPFGELNEVYSQYAAQ